ncbi:MAG TPA: TIGR02301 family protein [Lichenihabitans sp.]|jgi:uncharacterized protein (TIGR02301 family)|nr:TIGR02301 family protein [Lichenihabitans sp.]
MRRLCATLAIVIGSMLAAPAWSQAELPASPPLPPIQGEPSTPAPDDADALPPYEPQLERLAELMGTLAYMSDLCGRKDGEGWRTRMNALLDAEAHTPRRRERLAGAYNRGFTGYEATYRRCTPPAKVVIARSLAEGDSLARELATRFVGN